MYVDQADKQLANKRASDLNRNLCTFFQQHWENASGTFGYVLGIQHFSILDISN
jgi:hypothetical protein